MKYFCYFTYQLPYLYRMFSIGSNDVIINMNLAIFELEVIRAKLKLTKKQNG